MNETGYSILKLSKFDGAYVYAKEAREFATGSTGAGGYLNAKAVASGWNDVEFINTLAIGNTIPTTIGIGSTSLITGGVTTIGGTTPIGDLRAEATGYIGIGTTIPYIFEKGKNYSGALMAIYKGTTWETGKIGIGTTAGDITASGYYEGNFTTNDIHEFQTSFTADSTDLSKITTGSGVYTEGADVTLQFNILNRNGEQLSSAAQIAADPFVSGQKISILNTDGSVVFPDYRIGGDSTFNFSSSQNIDVFGTFTRNFGIRNEVVNQDGGVHTSEFYLYANTATFDKVFVRSSGQTVLNESYTNNSPPDTGSISSAADRADAIKYFNNQPINDSGVTGFIEFDLGFNESPNFTSLGDVVLFHGTGEDFTTNRGSLVGNFPLNSVQEGQRIRLTANDGIPEGTGLFFKLAADTEVGFNEELFTVGPFTLEPTVEGPDLNLYNQGDQLLVGDFTIEGGLDGDDAEGGNLNVSGNALGTGIGGRLTGPDSKMYLLSGDEAGGSSDTLQDVVDRGNATTKDINYNGSKIIFNGDSDKSINFENDALTLGIGITRIQSNFLGIGATTNKIVMFPDQSIVIGSDGIIVGGSPATGSSILAGTGNVISGHFNTLVGGAGNKISGSLLGFNFVGGGSGIDITGSQYSSSVGGKNNDILNSNYSIIGGGSNNKIKDATSSFIGGGEVNEIHDGVSAIVGGNAHIISGGNGYSFIGGGEENEIHGTFSSVLGGEGNKNYGNDSVTLGGWFTESSGRFALVGPGKASKVSGDYAVALGNKVEIPVAHTGATVLADGQDRVHASSGMHTATLDFASGVYVPTIGYFGEGLHVSGVPVLTGENNPAEADTLQTVTTRGNSTSTSILSTGPHISGVTGLFSNKVGIGTDDPSATFSIGSGDKRASNTDFVISDDTPQIELRDTGNSALISFNDTQGVRIFSNYSTSTSPQFTIENDGNVGIGTATPDDALTIVGTSADFSIRKADNNLAARIVQFSAGGGQLRLYDTGSNETIRLAGDGSNSFITGNVGIGTNSPSSALEVRGGNIDIGTNDIEGAANCKIEMDAADGFTLTNPNNAHGVDIVADDLTFFGGGLGNRKITTNAGDLSIDPTADLLLNETAGNVGIGTDSPTERVEVSGSLLLGPRSSSAGDTMPFLKIDGYDEHGIEMGWGTWTKWKITTQVNGQLEIYNTGIQHQSQQVSIGKQGYHKQGNLMVYSTGSVLRAGHNSTNYSILDIGVQDANSSYQGDAYIDVRADTSALSRFHFKRDGEFIASGVSVSGDVLGTGVGNRITNNGVPYLLSGDSPAETQTLQDVCDNGNTTTTSVQLNGGVVINEGGSDLDFRVEGDTATHALFVNGADNHVGIGTATPISDLTVYSSDSNTATVSIHNINNNETGSLLRLVEGNNHMGGFLQFDGSANKFNIGVHSTNDTTFANDTKAITIDRDTANVGIGTTNPTHKLDVRGDIVVKGGSTQHSVIRFRRSNSVTDFGYIGFENPSAANDEFLISSAGNGNPIKIQAGANDTIHFYGNTTAYGGFDGSGNFGIGTTSPNSILDIRDTQTGGASEIKLFNLDQGNTTTQTSALVMSPDLRANGVKIAAAKENADFSSSANKDVAITFSPVLNNTATERVRIKSDGKVGIGTTNPAAKLELLGKQMITTGANASPQTEDYLYIGGDGLAGADAAIYIGNRGNGSGYGWRMFYEGTGSGNDNKLKFKSENLGSPVDVITMLQDGKVGIGITNPSQKLHVKGIGIIEDASSTSFGTLQFGTNTTRYIRGNSAEIQFGSTIQQLHFQKTNGPAQVASSAANGVTAIQLLARNIHTSANILEVVNGNGQTADFVIDSDGKVGIGTTNPSAKLHVSSDSGGALSEVAHFVGGGSTDDKSQISVGGNTSSALVSFGFRNTGSGFGYIANASDTEIITIDGGNERVGIGTTSPSNALDVVGHFSATSKSFLIDHPTKENKKLQYASLEGPENGVYVRGTTDKETIELPEYWSELVHEDSITVVLTPIGKKQDLFIKEKSNKLIKIGGAEGSFDYVVYGERKDIDKLEIEPLKV